MIPRWYAILSHNLKPRGKDAIMSDDAVDHVDSIDERIRYYDMHIRELRKQESIAGVYPDSSIPVRIKEYERRRNDCYEEKQSYQKQFIDAKKTELRAFMS